MSGMLLFRPLIDNFSRWKILNPIESEVYKVSTIATRSIGGNSDLVDKIAIKVDAETYKDKWGIIEITVTSYAWGSGSTGGNYGKVDIRVPKYIADNDTPIVNNVALTTSGGTTSVTKKYCFAVNNGVPGPAAYVQPDDTWDLLYLTLTLPEDNVLTPFSVTLTYSIAFTDLTPSSNPSDTGTLSFSIDNDKTADSVFITNPSSTYSGHNGRVVVQLNDLHLIAIDKPDSVTDPIANDQVPLFVVSNDRSSPGFGTTLPIITHPTSKVGGDKNYVKKLLVYAINNGKVDGNGRNIKATTNTVSFMEAKIAKVDQWPCDDYITGILDYALTWTDMGAF